MKTTRNTITRTVTLQLTEEELKRAIITELGPISFELAQWDLAAVELDVDIDLTFELEEEGGWQTDTKGEDPRQRGAPDPGARSG